MGHELLLAAKRYTLTGDHCDKIRLLLRLTVYEYLEPRCGAGRPTAARRRRCLRPARPSRKSRRRVAPPLSLTNPNFAASADTALEQLVHVLIQDATYENLLKGRRQVLHRCVAEILRDRSSDTAAAKPEVLAHHFTQVGLTEAAIEWCGNARDQAWRRSAFQEARG